jgi:hypothetical protein
MRLLETILPAHFTRVNRIIFFVALLFSVGSLIALLNVSTKDDDESRVLLATLVDQEKHVTRKFSNSLSFNEINKGEKLFNGDQIFTGENSKAKIVFLKSRNVLNIPPRGLVKIEEGKSGINVEIQKGLAEFVIQKDQTLNIIKKGAETVVLTSNSAGKGTGKLYYNNNKLVLQVDSGQVKLQDSKGKTQEIKKNEAVTVTETAIVKIVTATLVSPNNGDKIDIWEGIDVTWKNKGGVELTLSKKSDFSEGSIKVTANSSPYRWVTPLDVGTYYFKVKSTLPKAREENPIMLEMYSPHAITTFNPANDSTVSLKRGEALHLSWNEVPADKYRVTLYNTDGTKSNYVTSKPEVRLQDLKDSMLQWSVAPLLKSGVYLADSAKKTVKVTYEGENKILTPTEGQKFELGKDKIQLAWNAAPQEKMHVKVMDTKQQLLFEKDLQSTQLEFTPHEAGHYVMELTSKDYPSIPAGVRKFTVESVIANWVSKDNVKIESVDPEEQKVEMKFEAVTKKLSDMEVVIYGDETLKNKLRSGKVLSRTILYPLKSFGTYCLVLRALDKDSAWLPSASKCIIYTSRPAFGKMDTPKNLVMKYVEQNGVGSYTLEVPAIAGASMYEVQVYKDMEGKNIVFTERSKTPVVKWPTKKTGIYFYRYKAIDKKQHSSEFSGMAKLVFPISPLTDWQDQ